jgi:hypothetical protein
VKNERELPISDFFGILFLFLDDEKIFEMWGAASSKSDIERRQNLGEPLKSGVV